MSKKSILISGMLIVVAVLGMLGFIIFKSSQQRTSTSQSTDTSQTTSVQSQPTKDFAPNLPMSKKTTILIRLSDSSTMKYIVPTDQVSTYKKNLPEGYTVVTTH